MKRPEWVWVIFICFSALAIMGLYAAYGVFTGTEPLPDSNAQYSSIRYYIETIGFSLLELSAASLLFFRIAFNRWLWMTKLILLVLSFGYSLLVDDLSTEDNTMIIGGLFLWLFSFSVAALITRYTFQLQKTGYYSNAKTIEPATSQTGESTLERPFWLTILLLVYGFFLIPIAFGTVYVFFQENLNLSVIAITICAVSLMLLSIFGLWNLKMWGVLAGIAGFLIVAVRFSYIGSSPQLLFLPGLLLSCLVFLWLNNKKSGMSSVNVLVLFLTVTIVGFMYVLPVDKKLDLQDPLSVADISKRLLKDPNYYFAAVEEVLDNSDCEPKVSKEPRKCLLKVRAIQYLGGSKVLKDFIETGKGYMSIEKTSERPLAKRKIGSKRLVIRAPKSVPNREYFNKLFIPDPTEQETEQLAAVIQEIQKTPSLSEELEAALVLVPIIHTDGIYPGDKITKSSVVERKLLLREVPEDFILPWDLDKIENQTVRVAVMPGEVLRYGNIVELEGTATPVKKASFVVDNKKKFVHEDIESSEPIKVLFIGNSKTYFNDMPEIFSSLVEAKGKKVIAKTQAPGGYKFKNHRTSRDTLKAVQSENWDIVVLQNHSQPSGTKPEDTEKGSLFNAIDLAKMIYRNHADTQLVYFAPWGNKNGDGWNCRTYSKVCNLRGHTEAVRKNYEIYQSKTGGALAEVGFHWLTVINDPDASAGAKDLWLPDAHPTYRGSYLAATTIYATIFNEGTIDNPFYGKLSKNDAMYYQRIASENR